MIPPTLLSGFLGGSVVKNPPANAGDPGDTGLIPRSGRSPREGNGNPLQYSCLENPVDRGAWWDTVHGGRKESDMTEQPTHVPYQSLIESAEINGCWCTA